MLQRFGPGRQLARARFRVRPGRFSMKQSFERLSPAEPREMQRKASLNWRRSLVTPPKIIAPSRQLPIGKASTQFFGRFFVPESERRIDGKNRTTKCANKNLKGKVRGPHAQTEAAHKEVGLIGRTAGAGQAGKMLPLAGVAVKVAPQWLTGYESLCGSSRESPCCSGHGR